MHRVSTSQFKCVPFVFIVFSVSLLSKATILDPRFKTLAFVSPQKAEEAVKGVSSEGAMLVLEGHAQGLPSTPSPSSTSNEIWQDFDTRVRDLFPQHHLKCRREMLVSSFFF